MSTSFGRPSRRLTSRDYQFIAIVVLICLLFAALLIRLNLEMQAGGGDFWVFWASSRAFLFDHIEPYSSEVAARVQQLVYDNSAPSGEEPFFPDAPFHILILYFPFSLIPDADLARAVFTMILEVALIATSLLSLKLTGWEFPPLMIAAFVVFSLLNYYSIQALLEGNPVVLMGFIYVGLIWSLRAESDELTGALLAVSLYYWQVGLPFVILVAMQAYEQKRLRVLAGFIMVSFTLLALSFLVYPDWFLSYLRAQARDLRLVYGFNIRMVFAQLWPDHAGIAATVWILFLGGLLGFEWSVIRNRDFTHFLWFAVVVLAATPLLGFRTEVEHLAVLVPGVAFILYAIHDRWGKRGNLIISLLLAVMVLFPWLVQTYPVFNQTSEIDGFVFLFYPVTTLLGLYWMRWWVLRAPHTGLGNSARGSSAWKP